MSEAAGIQRELAQLQSMVKENGIQISHLRKGRTGPEKSRTDNLKAIQLFL